MYTHKKTVLRIWLKSFEHSHRSSSGNSNAVQNWHTNYIGIAHRSSGHTTSGIPIDLWHFNFGYLHRTSIDIRRTHTNLSQEGETRRKKQQIQHQIKWCTKHKEKSLQKSCPKKKPNINPCKFIYIEKSADAWA